MKVPYLTERRRSEMEKLASEFANAISANTQPAALKQRLKGGWLNRLHSLFSLLEVLLRENTTVNPSREYALEGLKASGSVDLFLEAASSFKGSPQLMKAMRHAYSSAMFSGFIAELRSDLLMVFMHGLIYSYRGAAISLRCAIEDLYRHLYYMDHPQEYLAIVQHRESEYDMDMSPRKLRGYLKRASYLQEYRHVKTDFSNKVVETDMDLFGLNEQLYGSLSSAVHGASEDWFAALENADSLKASEDKEERLAELSGMFCKVNLAFLIAAHRDVFSAVGEYDKSLILDFFPEVERAGFRRILNL